jgi:2-keto-3-deoxy-L-rhamnonate aldolase RhmA
LHEILAPAGFEWLVVDMEHSSIELGELLPLIISIENNDMIPLQCKQDKHHFPIMTMQEDY